MSEDNFIIYHNPRCSKSRETLKLLQDNGVEPEIVEYLKGGLSVAVVKDILEVLDCSVRDILRMKEVDYKDNGLSDVSLSDGDLIGAIVKFPKILERPIVIRGRDGVVGRPPENVLSLL